MSSWHRLFAQTGGTAPCDKQALHFHAPVDKTKTTPTHANGQLIDQTSIMFVY